MSWFKVDDSLAFHAKTVAAGNAAMGLWLRAGAWCSQQLTDGLVPTHMVRALGGSSSTAKALVDAGLWTRDDLGYRFHDWSDYQPSAAEVHAERAAKHEKKVLAGRAGGLASGVARRKHTPSNREANEEANTKQNEAPSRPDPTPPDPSACGPDATPPPAQPGTDLEPHTHTRAEDLVDAAGPAVPAVRRRLIDHTQQLLDSHTPAAAIASGLADWHTRDRAAPGLLPNLVQDALKRSNGATGRPRPSTTDTAVTQSLRRAAELRAQEASA